VKIILKAADSHRKNRNFILIFVIHQTTNTMKHKNKVTLLDYAGGDKSHCISAWQSTSEELGLELPGNVKGRIDKIFKFLCKTKKKTPMQLLQGLAENLHHTPFESSYLHFQITGDIASHIHVLKHRIGMGVNGESARYKEFISDKWYVPEDWLNITATEETIAKLKDNPVLAVLGEKCAWNWFAMLDEWNRCAFDLYHGATKDLRSALTPSRAKESARYFLTYATQMNFDLKCNIRSFMHFQGLRNSDHAQREICAIAKMMLEQVREVGKFKLSLKAFGY